MQIPESNNQKYFFLFTAIGLFLLNLITKISFLDAEPFWYDEAMSIKNCFVPIGHIKHASDWDNNPPFYYYSIWAWIKVLGLNEFNARLLSVVFAALSTSVLFLFLKKHFDFKIALSAALLLSFHNFFYEFSHEARCYTLVVLLSLISTYLFFKFIEKPNYKNIIALGLINFLIVYTHYIAGLVLFFQLVFALLFHIKLFKQFSLTGLIVIGLVAIRFTKKQFSNIIGYDSSSKSFWLKKADWDLLKESIINLFSGEKVFIAFLILFFAAIIYFMVKQKKIESLQKQILIYFLFLSVGSISVLYFAGKITPIFLARYLLFTIPFICAIIAWFLFTSNKILGYSVIILIGTQMAFLNKNPKKNMDFRMAAKVVKSLKKGNEMVLLQTKDITNLFAYYYEKPIYMDYWHLPKHLKDLNIMEIDNKDELSLIDFKSQNTIIFCQTFEKPDDNIQIFDIFKQNNYVFTTTKIVKGVKISLLKKIKTL
jgi:hypothetical protein